MCAMSTISRGKIITFLGAACFCVPLAAAVLAQDAASDYPNRVIRIVVGFTPGGAPDITARVLAQKLSEIWKQPVIVENRPGAGSAIAAHYVADAAPDGYTLMSITNAHAVVPAINSQVSYDAVNDFAPLSMTSIAPNWVLVAPSLGVHSLKEFVALAKSKPNQLNFGSAGVGSFMHFAAAMFDDAVGIQAQHVPYKGPPEALADTVGGRVQYVISPIGAALELVREGKLVPLAVTGKEPSGGLSRCADRRGVRLSRTSNCRPGPACSRRRRLPARIVTKINQAIGELLKQPDVQEKLGGVRGRAGRDHAGRISQAHCRCGRRVQGGGAQSGITGE